MQTHIVVYNNIYNFTFKYLFHTIPGGPKSKYTENQSKFKII